VPDLRDWSFARAFETAANTAAHRVAELEDSLAADRVPGVITGLGTADDARAAEDAEVPREAGCASAGDARREVAGDAGEVDELAGESHEAVQVAEVGSESE
jgi:hypothetical protein